MRYSWLQRALICTTRGREKEKRPFSRMSAIHITSGEGMMCIFSVSNCCPFVMLPSLPLLNQLKSLWSAVLAQWLRISENSQAWQNWIETRWFQDLLETYSWRFLLRCFKLHSLAAQEKISKAVVCLRIRSLEKSCHKQSNSLFNCSIYPSASQSDNLKRQCKKWYRNCPVKRHNVGKY